MKKTLNNKGGNTYNGEAYPQLLQWHQANQYPNTSAWNTDWQLKSLLTFIQVTNGLIDFPLQFILELI